MFKNKNTKKGILKERTLLIIMSMLYLNIRNSSCLIFNEKKNKKKSKTLLAVNRLISWPSVSCDADVK